MTALLFVAGLLLGVGALASLADRVESRSRIPASVLLVGLGGLLALTPLRPPGLSRETMMTFLLAPLLFEGARAVHIPTLRTDARVILSLAIAGTLIASLIIAGLLAGGLGWPLATVLPFAALIAATDPVAVIATFRSVGLGGRLLTLVESESLLNDAVAAVVLSLVPMLLGTLPASGAAVSHLIALEVGLAVILGLGSGVLLSALTRRIEQPSVVSALHLLGTVALAAISQWLHASAVLSTVLAGLWVASRATPSHSAHRDWLLRYGHLANAAVFLLIGWLGLPRAWALGLPVVVALLAVLLARSATVYPLAALFTGRRDALPSAYQHVLVAGSLRGALALALVMPLSGLSLNPDGWDAPDLTVAVVALSVLTQGLGIRTVLRRTHLLPR